MIAKDSWVRIHKIILTPQVTGRKEQGTLMEVNPAYDHSFGNFIPELLQIDQQVREILFGGENND